MTQPPPPEHHLSKTQEWVMRELSGLPLSLRRARTTPATYRVLHQCGLVQPGPHNKYTISDQGRDWCARRWPAETARHSQPAGNPAGPTTEGTP